MKYLTDNYRLNYTEDISLKDIRNFVPDVISLLGAPEKLISFPQIGYFDIKGPSGNIKTIVTPAEIGSRLFRRRQETAPNGDQRKGERDRRDSSSRFSVHG